MRKLLLLVLSTALLAACSKDVIDEKRSPQTAGNRTLCVSLDEEDTRIQLNEELKTVWTEGDLVSVFYRSAVNEKWQYCGETGQRTGNIIPVDSSVVPPATTNHIVVVYPYNEAYFYNSVTQNVQGWLPATQHYLKDSYALDGNILISSTEYNQVSLKSVCGWIKLQLTGNGERVKSITLKGNNGEQVAGELYINSADATSTLASESGVAGDDSEAGGTLVRPGTILTEVILDCDEGVTLSTEATAFYIALPPQTFTNGFTIEVKDIYGRAITKSTSKELIIERNHIQPMAELDIAMEIPTNEIWYTNGSTTYATSPYQTSSVKAFGASLQTNSYDADKGCWVMKFSGDVTKVDSSAFSSRSITSIILPESVTYIGSSAFYSCSTLTEITLPDSVTSLGSGAFASCTQLKRVNIGSKLESVDISTFSNCPNLKFYGPLASLDGHCVINKGTLVAFAPGTVTEYTIPNTVSTVGEYAFYGCTTLSNITIPDSVVRLKNSAFRSCTGLQSVTIPESVIAIDGYAFDSCSKLKEVYCQPLTPPTGYYTMFPSTNADLKIYVPTESVEAYRGAQYWSDYVEIIEGYEFVYDSSEGASPSNNEIWYTNGSTTEATNPYNSAVFGANIVSNSYRAKYNCWVILFDAAVSSIGSSAFSNCKAITSITLPNSVTTIGNSAFYSCTGLRSITLPDSVTDIDTSAFSRCSNIEAFRGKYATSDGRCVVKDGAIIAYAQASGTEFSIPVGVTSIGYYAFYDCKSLTKVAIPDGVTNIQGFRECSNLVEIDLPKTALSIGSFSSCSSLKSLTIPEGATTIVDEALYGCSAMESIYIPSSVIAIGDEAFRDCTGALTINCNIPNSSYYQSDNRDSYPIFWKSKLSKVIVGEDVTYIGNTAFSYCSELNGIYIKAATPPTLGSTTFIENGADFRIYVPYESLELYTSADGWESHSDIIVGYDFENDVVVGLPTQIPITFDWYINATNGVYEIDTPEELVALSRLTNGDTTALDAVGASDALSFSGEVINLMADIDLGSFCGKIAGNWTPIKGFMGTFDGKNHTISNLYSHTSGSTGLFSMLSGATIRNIAVEGEIICSSANDVGAIASEATNTIFENCKSNVDITTSTSSSVTCVGGICGRDLGDYNSYCTFIACQSTSNISDTIDEWEWQNHIAGIVGFTTYSKIVACTHTDGYIHEENKQSYTSVGGICGYADSTNDFRIVACYTNTETDGRMPGHILGACSYRGSYAPTNKINSCYYAGQSLVSQGNKGVGTDNYGGSSYSFDSGTARSTDIAAEIINMNTAIELWNNDNPERVCNYRYSLDSNNKPILVKTDSM